MQVRSIKSGPNYCSAIYLKFSVYVVITPPNKEDQVKNNADWLGTVLVRSLTLRRFSHLKFDASDLVNNPYLLRSLIIEIDQTNPTSTREQLKKLLHHYNYIEQLSLTCLQDGCTPMDMIYHTFRAAVTQDFLTIAST